MRHRQSGCVEYGLTAHPVSHDIARITRINVIYYALTRNKCLSCLRPSPILMILLTLPKKEEKSLILFTLPKKENNGGTFPEIARIKRINVIYKALTRNKCLSGMGPSLILFTLK